VKYRKHVTRSVVDDMREKVSRLNLPPALSIRTGLIYVGELDPAIKRADYFDFLIEGGSLLR
jgi:hypothetical protein